MKSFLYLKEDFIWHRQEKICEAESCGKVNHRDVPMRGMYSYKTGASFKGQYPNA